MGTVVAMEVAINPIHRHRRQLDASRMAVAAADLIKRRSLGGRGPVQPSITLRRRWLHLRPCANRLRHSLSNSLTFAMSFCAMHGMIGKVSLRNFMICSKLEA